MKNLTEYADCAGCASKLAAGELMQVLDQLPEQTDRRVIVDYRTADDAGVYRWAAGPALVQTVDFFTPIVDDPYVFGQIAATNAVSDVYAMGGIPRTALAVAAFPSKDGPDHDTIRAIFKGGSDALASVGVALLGGHTVTDPEIKFGYAITGEVDPDRVFTNAGARPGDVLVLTKPLGTGIIVRAKKFGRADDALLAGAVTVMTRMNRTPIEVAAKLPAGSIRACTDVTGFGLAGHGSEMAAASGVTLSLFADDLPALPGALDLAAKNLPCGGRANERHFASLKVDDGVAYDRFLLCMDPQTSGGLLMSVQPTAVPALLSGLKSAGTPGWIVGRVEARQTSALVHLQKGSQQPVSEGQEVGARVV
jgi:selenide,water dikinase